MPVKGHILFEMQNLAMTTHTSEIAKTPLMKLLFITIAGNSIGYGHLSRCLALADYAAQANQKVSFLLFGDDLAFARVRAAEHDGILKPISALTGESPQKMLKEVGLVDVALMDFSRLDLFNDLNDLREVLLGIRRAAKRVVLIDALGEQAFSEKITDLPIDILVSPYVGTNILKGGNWELLEGPGYAVLSSGYAELWPRIIRRKAKRILVSCGGSDPLNLSATVLDALQRIHERLDIRVIVGPLFEAQLIQMLRDAVSKSQHAVALIDSPSSLSEHMIWCDVAIATTGLIKYELAATGTPAVLVSIDKIHDLINRPFAMLGSSLDNGTEISPQLFATQVSELLADYKARVTMSEAGQKIVDGLGVRRLIKEVIKKDFHEK